MVISKATREKIISVLRKHPIQPETRTYTIPHGSNSGMDEDFEMFQDPIDMSYGSKQKAVRSQLKILLHDDLESIVKEICE